VSGSDLELEIIGPDGVPVGVVRRPPPAPRRIWLNVLLFAVTLVTTTIVGGFTFGTTPERFSGVPFEKLLVTQPAALLEAVQSTALWLSGLAFSLPLMFILLCHESGHYLAARRHRLAATLPFFLPVPFGIGTFGAFIRIRSPILTRRELFDVGASGPLAGFLATLPFLVAGILLSGPASGPPKPDEYFLGPTLLFQGVVALLHKLPSSGIGLSLHPTAVAAWFGLFVTCLNLLPFGQLDGGHITYAMFGRTNRTIAWSLLLLLVPLGLLWFGWWLWALIGLAMRVRHPWIPGESVPLDPTRKALGWVCVVIFILCFTPVPIGVLP
jgi:membrane-associated protease RseP (regulator of RpoE activity)